MIRIENLSYSYSNGGEALHEINVEFPSEHIFAVLGESGSGKTTLLMCMGRFLRPQRGTITFDGADLYAMPPAEFRRRLGIVFQRLYLFPHLTVLQNMTLAPKKVLGTPDAQARREAMEMLERLGISDLADSYPGQISGGQAQRAAIARGLVLRPQYMLLDEPTSALDANTTDEFARWLIELRGETNFVIVTHDILFARQVAQRGVYLSDGRIRDTGRIDQIAAHVQAGKIVNPTKKQEAYTR
jgi:ABC-type polar amino acid transport system ATPase subunit